MSPQKTSVPLPVLTVQVNQIFHHYGLFWYPQTILYVLSCIAFRDGFSYFWWEGLENLWGVQLFASAWGVGLVGADRSKLERKKLCIILCLVYLRKYIRVAKILAINSIFGGGGGKNFWGGAKPRWGGLINILGGCAPPRTPPRKSVPDRLYYLLKAS